MSTSLAAQLRAIKSSVQGTAAAPRRPVIRPSVIFDPKEAADTDLRTILPIALSGFDILVNRDPRFEKYRNTLFSNASLDVDREKMVPKEEEKVKSSVRRYLRLLAGQLHLQAALQTLEYLIRRYLVHVLDMDELVLCALPYHDSHAFVRIVQLLDLGNTKWGFLEGVKTSGAPPPKKVIVQQCISDKGILEAICNYASPTKDFQQPKPVICFCTMVIVEALGSVPKIETDIVSRVLSFVYDGLNPALKGGRDHKAGALMVAGLLASRAVLSSKLAHNLVYFAARMAQHDANEFLDLSWLRLSVTAIVTLAQPESVHTLPKKTVMLLNEIRDFVGVLLGLSQEFNIQKFLSLYLDTLLENSPSEESCRHTLMSAIETLPVKELVEKITSKVFAHFMHLSRSTEQSQLPEAGKWIKHILLVIDKHYPQELKRVVPKFLETSKLDSKDNESIFNTFCLMLEGSSSMPMEISDSKILFSLEHPKASSRQTALASLSKSGILKNMAAGSKMLTNIHDAIIRRLYDDDLSVVQAAMSVEGLAGIINPHCFLKSCSDALFRCIDVMNKRPSKALKASHVAMSCLEHMVSGLPHNLINSEEVAISLFPLLLVLPKTLTVNMKVLELAKHVELPLYSESPISYDPDCFEQMKSSKAGSFSAVNMKTIETLSKTFIKDPQRHLPWLVKCSSQSVQSKTLFLCIILHALTDQCAEPNDLLKLYQATSPTLALEWEQMESDGNVIRADEVNVEAYCRSFTELMEQMLNADLVTFNVKILICIYWCFLKTYTEIAPKDSLVDNHVTLSLLGDLFMFFVKSPSKNAFKRHLDFLVLNCCRSPFEFLTRYFTDEGLSADVQIESLRLFASQCSILALSERRTTEEKIVMQLLLAFPPLFVPLCSENKNIREATLNCIEGLLNLLIHFIASRSKNGNDTILACSISTSTLCVFLESILSQRKLILSDMSFLQSYIASLLSPSASGLLVPESTQRRFDQPTKESILHFLLTSAVTFSSHGKLMVLSLLKGTRNSILAVKEVKSLLCELVATRNQHLSGLVKPHQGFLLTDIRILCLLIEVAVSSLASSQVDTDILDCIINVLKVDGPSSNDHPAVVLPCVTVLQNITSAFYDSLKIEIQDALFGNLVSLFRNDSGDVRDAVRALLLRINISCSTVVRFLELIISPDTQSGSSKRKKRNKLTHQSFGLSQDSLISEDSRLSLLGSLLDILLVKKNIEKRSSLLQPLLQVLENLFSSDWLRCSTGQVNEERRDSPDIPESATCDIHYARQTTLLILKDICDMCKLEKPIKDEFSKVFDMRFLVDCARSAKDVSTRNRVFMLLTSVTRISSEWLSEHTIDVFTIVGESVITQNDSHSQHVLEDLISTMVPCWLSKTGSKEKLFEIFIEALPEVAEHRRLTLMVFLLRTLGEKGSLGILVVLLFRRLILRIKRSSSEPGLLLPSYSTITREWEYVFATQLYSQYSSEVWFPSLATIMIGIEIHRDHDEVLCQLLLAMQFIQQKMQDTELVFELESGQDADYLQGTLGALMEQVILLMQSVSVQRKQHGIAGDVKELKACGNGLLRAVTRWMVASAYFKVVTKLLEHVDGNVKKQTLELLCEINFHDSDHQKHKERSNLKPKSSVLSLHVDGSAIPSFNELCMKIIHLIDSPLDESDTTIKLSAISSLEVLTKEFSSENMVFTTCLECVVRHIGSRNMAISAGCLRATGGLLSILGARVLPQLPTVLKHTIEKAHEISSCPLGKSGYRQNEEGGPLSSNRVPLLLSVLVTLEAVLGNFAGFLNPYLEDILDLVILHSEYASEVDVKLNLKATSVRQLLPQKIPVRLLLKPLMHIYSSALKCGESSISLVFEMLANMIAEMDRASLNSYHVEIFDHCLMALDLRRKLPESVENINMVEHSVMQALITLTMKLTETMFRPLFIRSLEWAESALDGNESVIDRTISFYKLINKLIEQHRSLFVPYFKYLTEGSARHLTDDQVEGSLPLIKKRKKSKSGDAIPSKSNLSPKQWHLRALILKALYHSFLYDSTDGKFLDATNFQVLLKPIVSQLLVDPPASPDLLPDIPTIEEVDETLVMCLGQMAVTIRSDVLWKPLNHDVLMHTRSEKIRARILGLKVVKFLVEHLKEEYIVFLAETLPFLGELLEDVEPSVKTLAQEILKELETITGEDLRQELA